MGEYQQHHVPLTHVVEHAPNVWSSPLHSELSLANPFYYRWCHPPPLIVLIFLFPATSNAWNASSTVSYRGIWILCHGWNIFFNLVLITIIFTPTTCRPWSINTYFRASLSSKPITILVGWALVVWNFLTVFHIMPKYTTMKTKGWKSFIPETYPNFSPSTLAILPPCLRGLSNWRSTLTLINLAWSDCPTRRSVSINLPRLLPKSLHTSSNISSKGSPQIWTQKGEWVKVMFVLDRPLLHLHNNKRLLSKFHGPFFSTHCNWYSELDLNCKTLFPTSTICKSEPIFQADLKVDFKALWFWCLSDNKRPNRLRLHSSSRSYLHLVVIEISSSSSSLMRRRLSKPSTTACSMVALRKGGIYPR